MNGKYERWRADQYWSDDKGYYKDVVAGFRVYYTEAEVRAEYDKLCAWTASDEFYRTKVVKEDYEKYFS